MTHVTGIHDLRSYLRSLDAEVLVEIVYERAVQDEDLYHRLETLAAQRSADNPAGQSETESSTHRSRTKKTAAVLDTVQRMLDTGTQVDMVPLARRTVDTIIREASNPEDVTEDVETDLRRAVSLYARACTVYPPKQSDLAEWISSLALDGVCPSSIELIPQFGSALDEIGINRIRSTVDAVLAGDDSTEVLRRRKIAAVQLIEQLAEIDGDIDALVSILSNRLPRREASLKIMRVLRSAGRNSAAVAYAAETMARRKEIPDSEGPARRQREAVRTDAELTQLRTEFDRSPTHTTYLRLRDRAMAGGVWPEERSAAIAVLRRHAGTNQSGADELARALAGEQLIEQAWEAGEQYGASISALFDLAKQREDEHPEDVITVYRKHIDELIAHKDAYHYRQAAKCIRRLRGLHNRVDTADDFENYLAELLETHKRKTRLIAEIRNARIKVD